MVFIRAGHAQGTSTSILSRCMSVDGPAQGRRALRGWADVPRASSAGSLDRQEGAHLGHICRCARASDGAHPTHLSHVCYHTYAINRDPPFPPPCYRGSLPGRGRAGNSSLEARSRVPCASRGLPTRLSHEIYHIECY